MANVTNKEEVLQKIIARAWQDETFKQKLVNNPRTVLVEEGIYLPESIEVKVIEESSHTFYLFLPTQPNKREELSEEALELVAGGIYDPEPEKPWWMKWLLP